jgi:hypothetical protein
MIFILFDTGAASSVRRAAMRVPTAPDAIQAKIISQIRIVPADGTRAAKGRKRGLRYVAVFLAAHGQNTESAHRHMGVPHVKNNSGQEIRIEHLPCHQVARSTGLGAGECALRLRRQVRVKKGHRTS